MEGKETERRKEAMRRKGEEERERRFPEYLRADSLPVNLGVPRPPGGY